MLYSKYTLFGKVIDMRLYTILMDLFESKEYLAPEFFMKKYCVSLRTVQNDMAYLRSVALSHGFELKSLKGKGFLIEIHDQKAAYAFAESMHDDRVVSMDERPLRILTYLALQNDYISMEQIADHFLISKTQIKIDMPKVENLAAKEHLQLEKKSHYGIRLIEKSDHRHRYLVKGYINGEDDVRKAVDNRIGCFDDVQNLLTNQIKQENLDINYTELINTLAWLKILVYTSTNKQVCSSVKFSKDEPIMRIAKKLIQAIEKKYDLYFEQQYCAEIIVILKHNIRIKKQQVFELSNLEDEVNHFLEEIDKKYEMDFSGDIFFKKMLMIHTSLLLERLNEKISYENPLAAELNIKNPIVFDIAIQFCSMLSDKYKVQVTFDEIGFVAAHFAAHIERSSQEKLKNYNRIAVVCSSGGGIAYMLQMQIQPLFSDAEIKSFSFMEVEELQKYKPDLIFTAIPLTIKTNAPTIVIKELLDNDELNHIQQIIRGNVQDSYIMVKSSDVSEVLFKKEFFQIVDEDNYDHLIGDMASKIELMGYGGKGYKNLVLEREKYVSTIYMNGVCIPHPIETDAMQNVISITILKKPFFWNCKEVKIVFMICLRKEQVETYKNTLFSR